MQVTARFINRNILQPLSFEKPSPHLAKAVVITTVALSVLASHELLIHSNWLLTTLSMSVVNVILMKDLLRHKNFTIFKTAIVANLLVFAGFMSHMATGIIFVTLSTFKDLILVKEFQIAPIAAMIAFAAISYLIPPILSSIQRGYRILSDEKWNQKLKNLHAYFQELPEASSAWQRLKETFVEISGILNIFSISEVTTFSNQHLMIPIHNTFQEGLFELVFFFRLYLKSLLAIAQQFGGLTTLEQKREIAVLSFIINYLTQDDEVEELLFILFNNRGSLTANVFSESHFRDLLCIDKLRETSTRKIAILQKDFNAIKPTFLDAEGDVIPIVQRNKLKFKEDTNKLIKIFEWLTVINFLPEDLLQSREKKRLVRKFLTPMVNKGLLTYKYPQMSGHLKQTYQRDKNK